MILKNNLYFSQADESDIYYLVDLLKQLFVIEKDFTFNQQKHIEGLKQLINDKESTVAIAKFEGDIIAMVTVQTVISTVVGGKVGLIEDFVVDDDYKNMGVGTHLFNYVKNQAKQKELKRLQLLCDNNNENAKEFYAKKTFKKSNLSSWYLLTD